MGEQQVLVELEQRPAKPRQAVPVDQLQLRQPNRDQFTYAAIDVERLVPADHLVRAVWELSGMLDLSGFAAHLETRKESAGRPAWDPRLLVAIWIWAYSERMSSAREIARQSRYRPELEWLCGMAVVNHHTLSDFRVFHSKALENLLTQVLALLSQEGLVDLEQVAVDGTRIRAQASGGSQRRRPTLERHLEQAREAVRQLSEEADDEGSNRRRQAARKRTLRERVERMEQALEELPKVEAGKRDEEQRRQARVSESEPEARPQHESNGGWGLGYNAQLATDAKEKIVVGVELTNNASDAGQLTPTLDDVEGRFERTPKQVLADGGYANQANIEALAAAEIEYATPAPAPDKGSKAALKAAGIGPRYAPKFFIYDEATDTFLCPAQRTLTYQRSSLKRKRKYRQYQAKASDCRECAQRHKCCPKSGHRTLSRSEENAVMAKHRRWMESERGRAAYRKRSETAEFPNAWLKERLGVRKFRVRGLRKARSELLWGVLAYNIAAWIRLVWRRGPECGLAAQAAA